LCELNQPRQTLTPPEQLAVGAERTLIESLERPAGVTPQFGSVSADHELDVRLEFSMT
jgi:hypothetical protein